uniref:Uncharacterized protein n=1 Tax=Arundo donax TaxID=35708 RepID=A0A0A8Y5T7_ARUDO
MQQECYHIIWYPTIYMFNSSSIEKTWTADQLMPDHAYEITRILMMDVGLNISA